MAATSEHGHTEAELRYVRQTYITRDNLRAAIVSVVNSTLEALEPPCNDHEGTPPEHGRIGPHS